MNKLLGVLFVGLAAIGNAHATTLSFSAETYAFDTYVNTTHVVWGAETLSGVIDVQDSPYQTNTNPVTGEGVSRFSFTGSFNYAGQTAYFENGSYLAIFHNTDGVHQDSYAIEPVFQPFAVTSESNFADFFLQNTVTDTLSLYELPDFEELNTTWSYVNGNIGLAQERAVISYGGHDFSINSIPEPSTTLLVLVASLGLMATMTRRNPATTYAE